MKILIILLLFASNLMADDNCEKMKKTMFEKANTREEFMFISNIKCDTNQNNTNQNDANQNNPKKYKNFMGEFDNLGDYWFNMIFGGFTFLFFGGLGVILLLFHIGDARSNFPMNGA